MVIVTLVIGGVLALFGMAEVNPAVGGAPRDATTRLFVL